MREKVDGADGDIRSFFCEDDAPVAQRPPTQVEDDVGIEMVAIDAGLEMQVFGRGAPRAPGQGDGLPGPHVVARLDQVLGVVAVDGLQPVVMTDNDNVAIRRVGLGHPHDSLEGRHDRVVGARLQVHAGMPFPPASIRRYHLRARQGERVFLPRDEGEVEDFRVAVGEALGVFGLDVAFVPRGERLRDVFPRRVYRRQLRRFRQQELEIDVGERDVDYRRFDVFGRCIHIGDRLVRVAREKRKRDEGKYLFVS